MLLNFDELWKKYNMEVKGVIHIGAFDGQEMSVYKEKNISNVLFFEPLSENFRKLKQNVGDTALCVNKAIGDENKMVEMYVEFVNGGQSSSILEPVLHLVQHPNITFPGRETVEMVRLDDYIQKENIDINNYNFINIDVQGMELSALKSGFNILPHIDYVMSEINIDEVYKNCAKIWELEGFLGQFGFKVVEKEMAGLWGDAFFVKTK